MKIADLQVQLNKLYEIDNHPMRPQVSEMIDSLQKLSQERRRVYEKFLSLARQRVADQMASEEMQTKLRAVFGRQEPRPDPNVRIPNRKNRKPRRRKHR